MKSFALFRVALLREGRKCPNLGSILDYTCCRGRCQDENENRFQIVAAAAMLTKMSLRRGKL
jgi:hypothetical protein